MKYAAAWLCLLGVYAHAQLSAPRGAADVTVRVFYTQQLQSLTATPAGAAFAASVLATPLTMRACARCAALPMTSAANVTASPGAVIVNGHRQQSLEVTGPLRITTSSGKAATAAGLWLIRPAADGLHVTLTLPSERYVMAVLASEAAPTEPAASLAALAVVARTFILSEKARHADDRAQVCDSTHCQALRLVPVSERIRQAVTSTAGETLWWHGRRAAAYFTEHCGGLSEDAAQLWGGPARPWLASHADPWCQRIPSAWHASLSQSELRTALASAGRTPQGDITALHIRKRDPAGRAAVLAISSTAGDLAMPAADFRFAVGRTLGWNRIRSDWYTVNVSNGRGEFDGRGLGHGAGLCQAGAAVMATQPGADARSILRFYFPGTQVRISASDQGWHTAAGIGWTLDSADPAQDEQVVREGNAALLRAQQVSGIRSAQPLTVQVFPSTELFRSSTSEPGWVTGATRANSIALQPVAIIQRHEPLADALLHEMLHALIEQAAAPATPLWFREGIVEALAKPRGPAIASMPQSQIESRLQSSASQLAAAEAHQAAAARVRALIARYGIDRVRGWLRNGIPGDVLAQDDARK